MRKTVVACGALALHINEIARRRGWELEVKPLPPELHNRPERIREALGGAAVGATEIIVGYADCGTRGALDDLPRLAGADCYQLFGGFEEHEAGTYYLTDFLVRSFDRVVWGSGSIATRSSATTTSVTTSASSGSRRGQRSRCG